MNATAPLKRTATEPTDEALQEVRAARRENLLVLLGVVLLALFPFVDHALGLGTIGSWEAIFVYVILAMGLNIVVGFAGLLDHG
jgi:ABC-type branched-subunit amino acid transport system permease subunit